MATEFGRGYVFIVPKMSGDWKNLAGQVSNSFGGHLGSKLNAVGYAAGHMLARGLEAAFGNIGATLSESIKYSDALTRFPLVLESLGITGDYAQKSIDKLNAGLKGTPILLTDATQSVQRLIATTGDVEKSTDWFLAFNNAVMAGGAPLQVQQAALEQWQQAVAKGRPDRIEFRSFMQSMPGVMNQVAKKLGTTAQGLGDMFTDGKLSMEQFNEILRDLNENGVEGFESLREQALKAMVGIDTGIGIMRKSVIEGFGQIFKTLNISKQMSVFQNIGDSLNTVILNTFTPAAKILARVFDDAISNIGNNFETLKKSSEKAGAYIGLVFLNLKNGAGKSLIYLVQPTIELFKKIGAVVLNANLKLLEFMRNHQILFKIIGKVASAVVALNIAFAGLSKAITIVGLLGKSISSLGALIFSPAGAIIAAVAVIGAAFKYLWDTNEEFRSHMIIAWTEIQKKLKGFADSFGKAIVAVLPVIKSLFKSFGGFAEKLAPVFETVAHTLFNVFSRLQEPIRKISETLLKNLAFNLGIILNTGGKVLETLAPAFGSIGNLIGDIAESMGNAFEDMAPQITEVFNSVMPIVETLAEVFKNLAEQVLPILGETFKKVFGNMKGLLDPLIDALNKVMPVIQEVLEEIGSKVGDILADIIPKIGGFVETILPALIDALSKIVTFVGQFLPVIMPIIESILDLAGQIVGLVLDALGAILPPLLEVIAPALDLIKNVIAALMPIFQSIMGVLKPIIEAVIQFVQTILPPLINIIKNILVILQPILGILSFILDVVLVPIITVIGIVITALIKLFTIIANYVLNVINGFTSSLAEVIKWLGDLWQHIVEFAQSLPGKFSQAFENMKNAAKSGIDAIVGFFWSIPEKIGAFFDNLRGFFADIGAKIIRWIIDGVVNAAKGLWDMIHGLFGQIGNLIPHDEMSLNVNSYQNVANDNGSLLLGATPSTYNRFGSIDRGYLPQNATKDRAQNVVYNFVFNNAELNDDVEMRNAAMQFFKEVRRKESM